MTLYALIGVFKTSLHPVKKVTVDFIVNLVDRIFLVKKNAI